MDCSLSNSERKNGYRCRSFNCRSCRDFSAKTKEMEKEAEKFEDVDILNFVMRGSLLVLQTSGDTFEKMPKETALERINDMIMCLGRLKESISKES